MKLKAFFRIVALAAGLILTSGITPGASRVQQRNDPAAESAAIKKLNETPGAAAKLDAAAEFIKKFPKSTRRIEVANHVAENIETIPDAAQRVPLAERALTIFTLPEESDVLTRSLLDAYLSAGRADSAFRLAASWLPNHPDEVDSMRRLAIVATNESIKGNNTFINQGRDYGLKAIAQLEADKRPLNIEVTAWSGYKTKFLPALYREVGVLALRAGDRAGAKVNLEKAAALKSADPIVYFYLSDIAHEEYMKRAERNKTLVEPERSADIKSILTLMDNLIELFAQTYAVSEGNAQFDAARKALRGELETYYKYRRGSLDGLQALIDKYKQPSR